MATAPATYADWVRLHPGTKNAAKLKASWDAYQSFKQGAVAPVPRFTPGVLDESGQANSNSLKFAYERAMGLDGRAGSIATDYEEQAAGLNSQLPRIQQAYQESLRRNASNVAARGLGSRSGVKQLYNARSLADYTSNTNDIQNSLRRLLDRRSGQEMEASRAYQTGQATNLADSNSRAMTGLTEARRAAGVDVAIPAPATPAAPKVTYQQFAQKLGPKNQALSTAQKQAAYRRVYGGG